MPRIPKLAFRGNKFGEGTCGKCPKILNVVSQFDLVALSNIFFPDFFRYFDQKSIFLTVFNGFEGGNWCKMVGGIFFPPGMTLQLLKKVQKPKSFVKKIVFLKRLVKIT